MATTESKIVAMALRLAGAGKTVGLNESQILALSAALSSVGIEAEAGGTAFSRVLKEIDKSIGSGTQKMDTFALIAGQSTAEFEKAWKENAADAVLEFIKGLDKAQKAGVNINEGLDELGFAGMRVSDSLLRATSANKLFNEAQKIGTDAWKENTALTKEAELRYKTTASQLILFKNEVKLLGDEFGQVMLPGLREVLKTLSPVVKTLKAMGPETKGTLLKVLGAFAIGGPILIGLGLVASAISSIIALGPALVAVFLAVTGPIGIIVAAITALIIAIKLLSDKAPKPTGPVTPENVSKLGGMGAAAGGFIPKSLSEVRIRVESEPGTRAAIDAINQSGPTDVQVENKSNVGPTLGGMAFAAGVFG